jgi:hypothetical protein
MLRASLILLLGPVALAPAQDAAAFQREIRPILAEHCFACHGPDAAQRKAGLRLDRRDDATRRLESGARAIDPDAPEQSAILLRLRHPDAAERMPPASTGKPLGDAQIERLAAWVRAGAPYAPHWSFVPPRRLPPPGPDPHPIDAFVRASLRGSGLAPSPPAAPATLARRITLDLTGLPPTPAEIDAYLADDEPGAFDRLLDRLFASPRHGEHMARYWLDAARYADTHGYHLDNARTIWPYRDWVVAAFQRNQPFDRFTIEQIAGDLLPAPTRDQLVATGFQRCLPTTAEGGLIDEEYLAKYAMDRVDTAATVWLGLTLGCAQCHDHKFDPFSQRDYYRLLAFWQNVEGKASDENIPLPPPSLPVPSPQQERRLAELDAEIASLQQQLDAPDPAADAAQLAWEAGLREAPDPWRIAEPRSALSRGGATAELAPDRSVRFTGANPATDEHELVLATTLEQIAALRIELLVDPAQQRRAGRAPNGNLVLGAVELETAPLGDPLARQKIPLVAAAADHAQNGFPAAHAIDADPRTGWALLPRQQQDRRLVVAPARPFGARGGTLLHLRLGYGSVHPQHAAGRVRVAVTAAPQMLPAAVSRWRVVGPFAAGDFATAFRTEFGPEREPDAAEYGERRWTERAELTDGAVHAFAGENCAHYLARTIDAPNARELTLGFGSDDGIRVWHDGALVLDREVVRTAAPDQDQVTLRLHPGRNRLLVKLVNATGQHSFFCRTVGEETDDPPASIREALLAEPRSDEQRERLRRYWRERHDPRWRELSARADDRRRERQQIAAGVPATLVIRDAAAMRPTHLLQRGRYDRPGEAVAPGVPAVLPPLEAAAPTRLDLARWLVRPDHPLTARVFVNRLWQQMFGTGLVRTAEDFGAQGEWPSHPELLDWLAVEFVESGWDVRHMLRLIATSRTYQQSSASSPAAVALDPHNRRLARGPRHRLDAEVIRDSLLAISGLLVERLGGPGVKPYQPRGIWEAVGYADSNTRFFTQDHGDALWRRSLYTYWKRTAPPPMFLLFDAPMREACTVRRARTNTPLQALALFNDVQYAEAARVFAARILHEPGPDAERAERAFRRATGRAPEPDECAELLALLAANVTHYRGDPAAAAAVGRAGEAAPPAELDPVQHAAWTSVASVLLNLDESLTKR